MRVRLERCRGMRLIQRHPEPSSLRDRLVARGRWGFAVPHRPLFLGAALLASLSVPLWLAAQAMGVSDLAGLPPRLWHTREMLFGFLPAVVAGYLLSVMPNRSRRLPRHGVPLAGLVFLWLLARLPLPAPLMTPGILVIIDAAFPAAVLGALLREARFPGPWPHWPEIGAVAVLTVGCGASRALFLLETYPQFWQLWPGTLRAALTLALWLIFLVGGRLTPSLTRSACLDRKCRMAIAAPNGFDRWIMAVTLPALGLIVADLQSPAVALVLAVVGGLHLARLARWRGWLPLPLKVRALHFGYAWASLSVLLAAVAACGWTSGDTARHAAAVGALGTMSLAVMVRLATTLGPLPRADLRWCRSALALILLATPLRLTAGPTPSPLLWFAAIAWSLGWACSARALAQGWLSRPRPSDTARPL